MTGEVTVELLRVPRLHPVVELLADRARELVDERDRVDELERLHPFADEARDLVQELEVGLDRAGRVRPLHLDGDAAPVRKHRLVHLADRRGRHGLALELEEELLDVEAELFADDTLDVLVRELRDLVLERLQLEDDVRRDDVGARREELSELHERRPELVEHLAQALAAGRAFVARLELVLAARAHAAGRRDSNR